MPKQHLAHGRIVDDGVQPVDQKQLVIRHCAGGFDRLQRLNASRAGHDRCEGERCLFVRPRKRIAKTTHANAGTVVDVC